MHHLQQKGVEKIVNFLKAVKCQYKIIDESGNVFTNIVEPASKKKNLPMYPMGELTGYIRPYIENIKPGDVIFIPKGKYDVARIASTASTHLSHKFGNGSCTTHRTDTGLEILRVY